MTEHPEEGSSHSSPASRHPVTARTKARRRAIEILFEADQRGLLRTDRGGAPGRDEHPARGEHGEWDEHPAYDEYDGWDEYGARGERDEYGGRAGDRAEEYGAARALRDLAVERAEHSANHTPAPAYAREILAGVADHLAEVDEAIETYAQGWALARMPAVDRAIARVATWEIVWNDDVDVPVAVDEAITLARMLSTDDSPRYLSGLLGRIGDLADTLR